MEFQKDPTFHQSNEHQSPSVSHRHDMFDMNKYQTGGFTSVEPNSIEKIKVRCPQCFKLFLVETSDIKESHPQFACSQCQEKFWLSYPECLGVAGEVLGFPMDFPIDRGNQAFAMPNFDWVDANPTKSKETSSSLFHTDLLTQPCPKCQEPYQAGEKECKKCGVLIQGYKKNDLEQNTIWAPKEVKESWESVLLNYQDLTVHRQFIRMSQRLGYIDYAAQKYAQMIEIQGESDGIARQMLQEVKARMEFIGTSQPVKIQKRSRVRVFFSFLFVICGVLMAMGYVVPVWRNLMGVGASLLVILLAFYYFFKS